MSQSELDRFISDVKRSEKLQEELKAAGAGAGAIVKVATGKGYDFSADELKAFVETKKGELSEEQLEKVAGGLVAGAIEVFAGIAVTVLVVG